MMEQNRITLKTLLNKILLEYIRKRGDEWVVVSKKGKILGRHKTKKSALNQLRAIEANKKRRMQ